MHFVNQEEKLKVINLNRRKGFPDGPVLESNFAVEGTPVASLVWRPDPPPRDN